MAEPLVREVRLDHPQDGPCAEDEVFCKPALLALDRSARSLGRQPPPFRCVQVFNPSMLLVDGRPLREFIAQAQLTVR